MIVVYVMVLYNTLDQYETFKYYPSSKTHNMTSVFRGTIEFFDKLGVYDVVLPFLLVFTIVYAIFEKTRVFGMEEINNVKYTKKNLNAMVAFVIAFFVIASSRLVEIITEVSANMVLLLMLSVFFLILVGSFMKEGEGEFIKDGWMRIIFMVIMFVGIIAIFLWAIKTEDGTPWLEWAMMWLADNITSTAVASILLILLIVGFMMYVVRDPDGSNNKKSSDD